MDPDAENAAGERQRVLHRLKSDINAFLWTRLPPATTLAEGEIIAAGWFDQIALLWGPDLGKPEADADPAP